MYRAILRAFPEHGGPPRLDDVHATARDLGLDPQSAVARLHDRDLIRLDQTGSAIASAYPFSRLPTAHRVEITDAQPVYAMCAIDALGIPFILAARSPHPDGLTRREIQVLRLIAAGRSNREMADALSISARTVERHVENAYRKINAHSKADATAYAMRHHLA